LLDGRQLAKKLRGRSKQRPYETLPYSFAVPNARGGAAICFRSAIESLGMSVDTPSEQVSSAASLFSCADIVAILRERGWLDSGRDIDNDPAMQTWLARAADLLGPHAADRAALGELLALIFSYDAVALLQDAAAQSVLAREGARDVIRELANRILDGADVDSDRFKEIVEGMKAAVPYRSRAMFHPIRLALAGRAGEGELDRVILLLDAAAKLDFAVPVKGTRQRMLEFCSALD
jgi:hypothetical protein